MLQTYKARLHGAQIEWLGDIPKDLHDGQDVHITILAESPIIQPQASTQGQQMGVILKKIAALNSLSIDDPMAWEREIRTDKPLADRES